MKKIITLSFTACALLTNNNAFSMLKRVAQIRPTARMFCTQHRSNQLPKKNIFTVSSNSISLELLEDYYDRNHVLIDKVSEQITLLQAIQNRLEILNDLTFNTAFKHHKKIKNIKKEETELQKNIEENLALSAKLKLKSIIHSETRHSDE